MNAEEKLSDVREYAMEHLYLYGEVDPVTDGFRPRLGLDSNELARYHTSIEILDILDG